VLFSGNVFEEAFLNIINLLFKFKLLLCLDLLGVLILTLLWCVFNIIGKLLHNLKVLLSPEFSLEDLLHGFLLSWSRLIQWLAELHDRDGTLSISNGGHILVHRDGSQWAITDLLAVSDFVLSIVEVPHIEETVNSSQEEETASCWRPATVGEVS